MESSMRGLLNGPGPILGLVLLLFLLIRTILYIRKRNRREKRAAEGARTAADLGWEHRLADTKRADVDEFSGTDHGIGFRMEVLTPPPGRNRGGRSVVTRWSTTELTIPDGFLALMTIRADANTAAGSNFPMGEASGLGVLAQQATLFFLRTYVSATFGLPGGRVIPRLPPVLSRFSPPGLEGTYTATGSDEQAARDFLGPPVDGLLLKWLAHVAETGQARAGTPALLLWREGLMLTFASGVRDPEEMRRMAALGAAICVMQRERQAQPTAAAPAVPVA